MTIRRILTPILASLILAAAPLPALAGGTQPGGIKYYDRSGRYQGRSMSDGRGQTKSYDRSGHYQGKAVRQGKTIKLYDKSGRYIGRVTR